MTDDRGREAVYAAETAAFGGTSYEVLTRIEELVGLAASITGARWWGRGPVSVVVARRDAHSSSASQVGATTPIVRLAAPQFTQATVVHELAHVLAGVGAGHGPAFRRAHLDLVGFAFGSREAGWLRDAYRDLGLEVGSRTWEIPPRQSGDDGPIAL